MWECARDLSLQRYKKKEKLYLKDKLLLKICYPIATKSVQLSQDEMYVLLLGYNQGIYEHGYGPDDEEYYT